MSSSTIGTLERVSLREVWVHEAYDFTVWLKEHIHILNEALGIDIVSVEREQSAGTFSIDLVAEDQSGNKIIIENQLEKSNHDHLGKLITYLTAKNARTAIWIVSQPRPEHVAAISWLNDSSSGQFYLLKIEAVKIGDSRPAPLLTVIVGPSDEKPDIARTNKEFVERHDSRLRWWKMLVARPDATLHAHIKPGPSTWIGISSGLSGLAFNYSVTQFESAVELYIDRGKDSDDENVAILEQLLAEQELIESEFGDSLVWQPLDGKRACRIKFPIAGGYKAPEEEWVDIQDQMVDAMNRLESVFKPRVEVLKRTGGPDMAAVSLTSGSGTE